MAQMSANGFSGGLSGHKKLLNSVYIQVPTLLKMVRFLVASTDSKPGTRTAPLIKQLRLSRLKLS